MADQLIKTEKRYLRYDFRATEIHDLAMELANKNQQVSRIENEKKAATSQFSSQISSAKSDIQKLSDNVSSGYEIREVQCDIEYHKPKQGMKTLVRRDTSARIEEKMTDADFNLWTQYQEEGENAFIEK